MDVALDSFKMTEAGKATDAPVEKFDRYVNLISFEHSSLNVHW